MGDFEEAIKEIKSRRAAQAAGRAGVRLTREIGRRTAGDTAAGAGHVLTQGLHKPAAPSLPQSSSSEPQGPGKAQPQNLRNGGRQYTSSPARTPCPWHDRLNLFLTELLWPGLITGQETKTRTCSCGAGETNSRLESHTVAHYPPREHPSFALSADRFLLGEFLEELGRPALTPEPPLCVRDVVDGPYYCPDYLGDNRQPVSGESDNC